MKKPVYDHYWQTETGWPLITALPGITKAPAKFGSPSFAAYGYDVRVLHERTGEELNANEKGVVCVQPPVPPGCIATLWNQDEAFVDTYFTSFKDRMVYTIFD